MALNIEVTAQTAKAAATLQEFWRQAAQSFKRVEQASKLTTENAEKLNMALVGISRTASLFAGSAAQQVIYPLTLVAGEAKTVAASMKLVGLSAPVAGAAITALTAIFVTLAQYLKMVNAQSAEFVSQLSLMNQQASAFKGSIEEIWKAFDKKLITQDQADALAKILTDAVGKGPDAAIKALKAVRAAFVDMVPKDDELKVVKQLGELQAELSVETLEGYARQRGEADKTHKDRLAKIDEELAKIRVTSNLRKDAELVAVKARNDAEAAWNLERNKIDADEQKSKDDAFHKDLERVVALNRAEREATEQAAKEWDDFIAKRQTEMERVAERARQNKEREINDDWSLTDAQKFAKLRAEGFEPKGPDPESWSQNWRAAAVRVADAFGTLQQNVTGGALQLIQQGVQGISDAITGIIIGTKTASQAFAQFGLSMLTSFISMITNALLWAYVAIPVLTALGVLSGGATAAVGAPTTVAAVAGAMGAVAGMTHREQGGPVIAGMPYIVGEKRAELFVPNRDGYIHPGVPQGRDLNQTIFVHFDKQRMLAEARDELEVLIVDTVARNKMRLGIS